MRRLAVAVVACIAAGACSGDPATPTTEPAPASTATTTTSPATTTSTSTTTTTTSTTTTSTTSTTTTSTTSTTTTEPAPPTTEAARRGDPRPLRAPIDNPTSPLLGPWETGADPLTGQFVDPALATRPTLAVKIDNSSGGRPAWNLADADMVFEENVEGITRFIALYHTTEPDRIGPVRSARTSDTSILAGLNRPVLAWSGGNGGVTNHVNLVHAAGWLASLSAQRTDCFWRSSRRAAPHNLLLDPLCAWASATHAGPARPILLHDPADVPVVGPAQASIRVAMDGITVRWEHDPASNTYLRRQAGEWHVDADGEQVAARNVVVLRVEYGPSFVDARSPEARPVGSGSAVVYRDGVALEGTWTRPDVFAPFTITAADGLPILLAPGKTWVELARA